jgi:hypothetical protein
MKKRYAVRAYVRRNAQPVYTYDVHSRVRPGKALATAHQALEDIISHESRSGARHSVTFTARGGSGRVYTDEGYCKFVVRVVPV